MTEKVLSGGVFGFQNADNLKNAARTAVISTKGPRVIKRIGVLLRATFPGYGLMRGYPGCGYLYNRKYLLPIAWIHRICKLLIRKDKARTLNVIKDSLIPNQELDEREVMLSTMGLK